MAVKTSNADLVAISHASLFHFGQLEIINGGIVTIATWPQRRSILQTHTQPLIWRVPITEQLPSIWVMRLVRIASGVSCHRYVVNTVPTFTIIKRTWNHRKLLQYPALLYAFSIRWWSRLWLLSWLFIWNMQPRFIFIYYYMKKKKKAF